MTKDSKIYVAGHAGMVGSALVRALTAAGFKNILERRSSELDLRNQLAVATFFEEEKPDYVFLAAAHVGGIHANDTYRADFLYDNLMIEANIIHHAHVNGVKKLLFLGSSCVYPKFAPQPIVEESLLTGILESTNEPYAIAKIAGIKMCESYRRQHNCNFISVMPANLYGPNDTYHLENSHVIPALIKKFHTAQKENSPTVEIWGTGTPLREFLHVDDLARACLFLMERYDEEQLINIGFGEDISIADLARFIKKVVDYTGEIVFNTDKPDGTPRKLMDSSKLRSLGWAPTITLKEGLTDVYAQVKGTLL